MLNINSVNHASMVLTDGAGLLQSNYYSMWCGLASSHCRTTSVPWGFDGKPIALIVSIPTASPMLARAGGKGFYNRNTAFANPFAFVLVISACSCPLMELLLWHNLSTDGGVTSSADQIY